MLSMHIDKPTGLTQSREIALPLKLLGRCTIRAAGRVASQQADDIGDADGVL